MKISFKTFQNFLKIFKILRFIYRFLPKIFFEKFIWFQLAAPPPIQTWLRPCKGTRQIPSGIGKRLQKPSGIYSTSQCRLKYFQSNVVISNEIICSVNFKSFISFTKQFFTFHFNRVKCEKQEVVGSNPTEGKIYFSLLEWNVKNCIVKLIKTSKINRIKLFRLK